MIAWFIRFGTAIFGDTNLGVRFAGIVAMLVTQLLLADIVRRVTHDFRAIVFALLMPEAALYYGLLMAKQCGRRGWTHHICRCDAQYLRSRIHPRTAAHTRFHPADAC